MIATNEIVSEIVKKYVGFIPDPDQHCHHYKTKTKIPGQTHIGSTSQQSGPDQVKTQ